MGDYQNKTWPEKLHLSDMHASEIVNWMQDFDAPEAGYADSRGHYTRADLHAAAIAERDALRAEVERLREALTEIGSQKKTTELETEYDVEVADFEDGYDMCIDRARAVLGDTDT